MKRTIRYSAFETNSSSVHAFVVFEDKEAQQKWMDSNQEVFLDGRYFMWLSCHQVASWEDFDPMYINVVGDEHLVTVGSPEWKKILQEINAEYESFGDSRDNYPDIDDREYAEWNYVVPYGEFYDGYHSKLGGWYGDYYKEHVDKDEYGDDIFTIVCDE